MGRAPARSGAARPKKVQMEKQDRERASAPIAQERVRRSSKKKRRDVQRRTRGSASLPAPAERLGPIISTVHTNESTLTRNKGLLVSPFLELFLDRSGSAFALVATARPRQGRRSRSPRIARPSPRTVYQMDNASRFPRHSLKCSPTPVNAEY